MEPQDVRLEKRWTAAREKFDGLCGRLEAKETLGMTHSGLESLLRREGDEILRLLFQDHLALRKEREVAPVRPVVGQDGVARTHRRQHERPLETIFGTVEVSRLGHGQRGVTSLHPLDAALNLPPDRYSFGLRRRVAETSAVGSFDAVVETVATTTAGSVPKRQAEELARRAAVDFEAFYESQAATQDQLGSLLVMSLDGKGVVMRLEDLQAGTRKKAQATTHKRRTRLSPGEKRNAKRMATVAAVYTVDPHPRSPEDVATPKPTGRTMPPRPVGKRVWASLERPTGQVVTEMFDESLRQDPAGLKTWVCLTDGNPTQIRLMQKSAKALGVQLIIILDLIHVIEYLWKAAAVFHKTTTPEAETWVAERLLCILKGGSSEVAAGMRRATTKRAFAGQERKPVDKCADYLLKYRACLRYDCYLEQGFPIATGVIEGACRHLIKDRMDVTGARWSLEGAEAVLKLRALKASGDFGAYWSFHEASELERNHTRHYATLLPFKWPNPQEAEVLRKCSA